MAWWTFAKWFGIPGLDHLGERGFSFRRPAKLFDFGGSQLGDSTNLLEPETGTLKKNQAFAMLHATRNSVLPTPSVPLV